MGKRLHRFAYEYKEPHVKLTHKEYDVTRETDTHVYYRDGEREARSRLVYLDQPRMRTGNYVDHLHFEMLTWDPYPRRARDIIVDHINRTIVERIRKAEDNLDSILGFHVVFHTSSTKGGN